MDILTNLITQKFNLLYFPIKLLKTKDRPLIMVNNHGEQFWGATENQDNYQGENHLGNILMETREKLKHKVG